MVLASPPTWQRRDPWLQRRKNQGGHVASMALAPAEVAYYLKHKGGLDALFSAFLSFYLHSPYIFPKRPGDPLGICGVQYSWAHTHAHIYIFLYRLLAWAATTPLLFFQNSSSLGVSHAASPSWGPDLRLRHFSCRCSGAAENSLKVDQLCRCCML